MKLELSKLKPSKFRNFKLNPLDENKITALIDSINADEFWAHTVLTRKVGTEFEIVYGHHRVEAARRAGIKFAEIPVEELDDAKALLKKSLENRKEYDTNTLSLLEDIEAEVKGIAEGIIPAPILSRDTRKDLIRYAPSYVPGTQPVDKLSTRPYTTLSIAQRLKYTQLGGRGTEQPDKAVSAAIRALYLIEVNVLTPESIRTINVDQLDKLTKDREEHFLKDKAKNATIAEEALDATRKLSAIDAEERTRVQATKVRKDELVRKEVEANRTRDIEAAKEAIALRKQEEERGVARAAAHKIRRDALDKIVQERTKAADAARNNDKNLPTRYAVKTMLGKLKLIPSENFAFREEVKTLVRDPAVTLMERDLLYRAMKDAGQWYFEWGEKFAVTPKHTGVLAEARRKEEMKRKLNDVQKERK